MSTETAAEGDLDLGDGDGLYKSGSFDSTSLLAASLGQEEEQDEEETESQNTIATATTTATTATIFLAAALSLAVAVVVAMRRRSSAHGVDCGDLNEMPWELHLVSAEMEDLSAAEQSRDPERIGFGGRKHGYSSITAYGDE